MVKRSRIVALVLAAGYSSRMGVFKPLAPLGSSTLMEEAVSRFHRAGIGDVRVVVGHRHEELIPVLDRLGARWFFNPHYDRDMISSVRAGVESFEPDVAGCLLLPGDIPLVRPETIRALLNAFAPDQPRIIYPLFGGQRGHPPLIPASYLRGDLPREQPGGLRAYLKRHDKEAVDLNVVDEGILLDCDTLWDLGVLTERQSREDIPTEAECRAIWSQLEVPQRVTAHCLQVAQFARLLALRLNGAGLALNLPLVLASSLLHDIARGKPDHDVAGATILSNMGYPRVGAIVAQHMDIQPHESPVNEADLVYFADKCIEAERLLPMEGRFAKSMDRYAERPHIQEAIRKRLGAARVIAGAIEKILGSPLGALMCQHEKSMDAACVSDPRVIYLVRHGAIQSPGDAKRFIGHSDFPLSVEGLRQAEQLRETLGNVSLSAIFCSDLKRSACTAEIIARPHGLPYTPRRELREIFLGRWEGMTFDEVRLQCPDEFEARGDDIFHFRPPGGESFRDCALRIFPAFCEILNSTGGNILVIGHAGVNRILLSQWLGRSLGEVFSISQDYGCLNVILDRQKAFAVMLLNGLPSDLQHFDGNFPPA